MRLEQLKVDNIMYLNLLNGFETHSTNDAVWI